MSTMSETPGVPFSFFTSLLREITQHSSPRKAGTRIRRDKHPPSYPALNILKKWIARLRDQFSLLPEGTTAIVFRLLFPEEDIRRKYDMQETRLASALADCFGISGNHLRRWRAHDSSGCLGEEVLRILNRTTSDCNDCISPLSIAQIDDLLDELASHSGYSHNSVRSTQPRATCRPKSTIIRALYRSLSPLDAAFLTQIILKDLRPLLYPLAETHYTAALKAHNSTAITHLSKEHAMLAWDPTRQMLNIYRVRARLDDASIGFDSGMAGVVMPLVGTPVEIPKCEKGRGCVHALKILQSSNEVWAETKYDGERAQIHVEILDKNRSRITVLSKSKRDSTQDRYAVHSVIRAALGLPEEHDTGLHVSAPSKVETNVILDAEMVVWHGDKIDEFWRIRTLIEHTARGVRGPRDSLRDSPQLDNYSQASLMTDVSDARHLGLVFFDILLLNSTSLLSVPYSTRRSILQSVIRPVPNRAMLAERKPIATHSSPTDQNQSLYHAFAQCLAYPEEGLVLKAGEAGYNDKHFPWVKLKRDYIPGYGDCVDLVVLGASWDKERGRELRVPDSRPHFHIYFTVSYGLDRNQLEEANFLIKTSDPVPHNPSNPYRDLPFTYTMLPDLIPPAVILREPLLGELFGAGFTKSPGSRHYELRFPRITKVFRPSERSWVDGCVGRDRADKDVDDWGNSLWGKPVSPGVNSSLKRKLVASVWEEKLIASDRKLAIGKGRIESDSRFLTEKQVQESESPVTSPSWPFGARTNLGGLLLPSSSITDTNLALNPHPSPSRPKTLCLAPSTAKTPLVIPHETALSVSAEQDLTSILDVLSHSLVFVAAQNERSRRRWKKMIPPEKIVHSLESLLAGLDSHAANKRTLCSWVQRGVVILGDDESAARWKTRIQDAVNERQALRPGPSHRKPIWVVERSL
ncbi:hypothetical protein B0H10DRAFT_2017849 [Mycena sp. CBHHK59/15]|nr:hypothetical protein B0H10DRAFT_2017849 [Mycena sp. CBHHK59/15]